MMRSTASLTLDKARLFLEQARRADRNDRYTVSTNLEGAIVFCRSVTFHLQSQFAHAPGFDAWYAQQQNILRGQRLSRFLLEQRNYVLKIGPAIVNRIIGVSITESVMMRDELTIKVVRGQPWYRRSPKILLEDLAYPLRQHIRLWRERRRWRAAAKTKAAESAAIITTDELHFADTEWKEIPAIELIEQQLAILANIVAEAEARFLSRDALNGNAAQPINPPDAAR
jgi:hypothetical protein